MKPLLLLNTLIISVLSINGQNLVNESVAYNTNINQSQQTVYANNYNNVDINTIQVQKKVKTTASQKFTNISTYTNKSNPKKVVNQKPKTVVQNPVNNVSVNNVGNNNLVQGNVNGNPFVNDNNVNTSSNPQINNFKSINNKPIVVEEYKGIDFKPSGLSGRGYTGGKLKKGEKNFYKASASKSKNHKPKKRPSFKKVKHHTSKCANW